MFEKKFDLLDPGDGSNLRPAELPKRFCLFVVARMQAEQMKKALSRLLPSAALNY